MAQTCENAQWCACLPSEKKIKIYIWSLFISYNLTQNGQIFGPKNYSTSKHYFGFDTFLSQSIFPLVKLTGCLFLIIMIQARWGADSWQVSMTVTLDDVTSPVVMFASAQHFADYSLCQAHAAVSRSVTVARSAAFTGHSSLSLSYNWTESLSENESCHVTGSNISAFGQVTGQNFWPEAVLQVDVNHCQCCYFLIVACVVWWRECSSDVLSVVISSLLPALCGDVSVAVTCWVSL